MCTLRIWSRRGCPAEARPPDGQSCRDEEARGLARQACSSRQSRSRWHQNRSRPSRRASGLSVCSRSSLPPPRPAPRWRPTASISSIKMMQGSFFLAVSNMSRTRAAPTPDEHFNKVRTGNRKERHSGFTCNCLGKEVSCRFPEVRRATGRAVCGRRDVGSAWVREGNPRFPEHPPWPRRSLQRRGSEPCCFPRQAWRAFDLPKLKAPPPPPAPPCMRRMKKIHTPMSRIIGNQEMKMVVRSDGSSSALP